VDVFEVDGVAPHTAERFFGRVETFAKETFVTLRSRKQPTKVEREKLAVFMALCLVRSSKRTAENGELAANLTLSQLASWVRDPWTKMRWMLQRPRVTATEYDEIAEQYLHGVACGEIALPAPARGNELSLVRSACTQWAAYLEGMEWYVEVADGPDFFVVADEPLVTRRRGHPFDPTYVGVGRHDLGAETTFPLNRRMCLVLGQGDPANPVVFRPAASARVEEINLRSIVSAHRLIFSPARSESIDKLIGLVGDKSVKVDMPTDLVQFLADVDWGAPR
jgi:hypothetical protein